MKRSEKINVLFFGTPEFASRVLRTLLDDSAVCVKGVITQIDKPAGRGAVVTPPPVKSLALERNIPIFQPRKLRLELDDFKSFVSVHGPFDIGIVVAFGQILPPEVLETPANGCLNLHASLLPRWRGADPIRRALIEGDAETGISLMKMDEGLDTGAVYAMDSIRISKDMTFDLLHDELAKLGSLSLSKNLSSILNGELSPKLQPHVGVTYASKIANDEAKIDWEKSAKILHNLVRGLSPVPGAFTLFRGKRLKVLLSSASDTGNNAFSPGTIIHVDKRQLEVGCKEGALKLLEVQPEGKRRMGIEEFLAGNRLSIGDVLGV